MKIMIISTFCIPTPPPQYGGLEEIAWLEAEELAKRGHTVALVAASGSKKPYGGSLIHFPVGTSEAVAFRGYRKYLAEQDIIHDHSWEKWSYIEKMEKNSNLKIMSTLHAPIPTMYKEPPPVRFPCFIGLSQNHSQQGSAHLGIPIRTVYNGINLDFYKPDYSKKRNDVWLYLNRISRIKSAHEAIDIAKRLRIPLEIWGDTRFTQDPVYANRIMDQCTGMIRFMGEASREKTVELYQTRKALLNTVLWPDGEPFGLVPVEAAACGMPVLSYANGGIKETMKNGRSGYLVKNSDEAIEIIKSGKLDKIHPKWPRKVVEKFSVQRMVDEYEKLMIGIVKRNEEW